MSISVIIILQNPSAIPVGKSKIKKNISEEYLEEWHKAFPKEVFRKKCWNFQTLKFSRGLEFKYKKKRCNPQWNCWSGLKKYRLKYKEITTKEILTKNPEKFLMEFSKNLPREFSKKKNQRNSWKKYFFNYQNNRLKYFECTSEEIPKENK